MREAAPIAIAISDLHLSLLQPACRADKSWRDVQSNYLQQVRDLQKKLGEVPILCAGDIFDRWNPPAELIHFALDHLPNDMLCVPGQHDLPNHRIEDMHRCGYGVLKKAGKIRDCSNQSVKPFMTAGWKSVVYGYGWNQVIEPPSKDWVRPFIKIALIHRYCWVDGKSYPGAPEDCEASTFKKMLKGYDVAVFGDNHISFSARAGDCTILNPGGLIRRKSDEIDRNPCVGIIFDDGTVKRKRLDTSSDKFHEIKKDREEVPINMKEFIEGLEGLGEHGLNFREAVENHLKTDDIDPETKELILRALEERKT